MTKKNEINERNQRNERNQTNQRNQRNEKDVILNDGAGRLWLYFPLPQADMILLDILQIFYIISSYGEFYRHNPYLKAP